MSGITDPNPIDKALGVTDAQNLDFKPEAARPFQLQESAAPTSPVTPAPQLPDTAGLSSVPIQTVSGNLPAPKTDGQSYVGTQPALSPAVDDVNQASQVMPGNGSLYYGGTQFDSQRILAQMAQRSQMLGDGVLQAQREAEAQQQLNINPLQQDRTDPKLYRPDSTRDAFGDRFARALELGEAYKNPLDFIGRLWNNGMYMIGLPQNLILGAVADTNNMIQSATDIAHARINEQKWLPEPLKKVGNWIIDNQPINKLFNPYFVRPNLEDVAKNGPNMAQALLGRQYQLFDDRGDFTGSSKDTTLPRGKNTVYPGYEKPFGFGDPKKPWYRDPGFAVGVIGQMVVPDPSDIVTAPVVNWVAKNTLGRVWNMVPKNKLKLSIPGMKPKDPGLLGVPDPGAIAETTPEMVRAEIEKLRRKSPVKQTPTFNLPLTPGGAVGNNTVTSTVPLEAFLPKPKRSDVSIRAKWLPSDMFQYSPNRPAPLGLVIEGSRSLKEADNVPTSAKIWAQIKKGRDAQATDNLLLHSDLWEGTYRDGIKTYTPKSSMLLPPGRSELPPGTRPELVPEPGSPEAPRVPDGGTPPAPGVPDVTPTGLPGGTQSLLSALDPTRIQAAHPIFQFLDNFKPLHVNLEGPMSKIEKFKDGLSSIVPFHLDSRTPSNNIQRFYRNIFRTMSDRDVADIINSFLREQEWINPLLRYEDPADFTNNIVPYKIPDWIDPERDSLDIFQKAMRIINDPSKYVLWQNPAEENEAIWGHWFTYHFNDRNFERLSDVYTNLAQNPAIFNDAATAEEVAKNLLDLHHSLAGTDQSIVEPFKDMFDPLLGGGHSPSAMSQIYYGLGFRPAIKEFPGQGLSQYRQIPFGSIPDAAAENIDKLHWVYYPPSERMDILKVFNPGEEPKPRMKAEYMFKGDVFKSVNMQDLSEFLTAPRPGNTLDEIPEVGPRTLEDVNKIASHLTDSTGEPVKPMLSWDDVTATAEKNPDLADAIAPFGAQIPEEFPDTTSVKTTMGIVISPNTYENPIQILRTQIENEAKDYLGKMGADLTKLRERVGTDLAQYIRSFSIFNDATTALNHMRTELQIVQTNIATSLEKLERHIPDIGRKEIVTDPEVPYRAPLDTRLSQQTVDELTRRQNDALLARDFYHGTKVHLTPESFSRRDFVSGSSRSTLGTGLYLTPDREYAGFYAKADATRNLPTVERPREFLPYESGEVHHMYLTDDAKLIPSDLKGLPEGAIQEIRDIFLYRLRLALPAQNHKVAATYKGWLTRTNPTDIAKMYDKAFEYLHKNDLFDERVALNYQRDISYILKQSGIDGILNHNQVVLFDTNKMIHLDAEPVPAVSNMNAAIARFNADSINAATHPNIATALTDMYESGLRVQSEVEDMLKKRIADAEAAQNDAAAVIHKTIEDVVPTTIEDEIRLATSVQEKAQELFKRYDDNFDLCDY